MCIRFFIECRRFLMLFLPFKYIFSGVYPISSHNQEEKMNKFICFLILLIFIKGEKGRGGCQKVDKS